MITKNDWQNLKNFINPPFNYQCNLELTAKEVDNLRHGYRSFNMDVKWFSYCEENTLYIHRSWTGHLMYRAQLHGLKITNVDIAMDDFVKLSTEQKIDVFHSVVSFLSSIKIEDGFTRK